jgi:hypothetical protein
MAGDERSDDGRERVTYEPQTPIQQYLRRLSDQDLNRLAGRRVTDRRPSDPRHPEPGQ